MYPHGKKSQSVQSGFWMPSGRVACCSRGLIQSVGERDIHRDNLARRQTSVVLSHTIGQGSCQCRPATAASSKELTY
ncbi:hypothetical protein TNCV_3419521 [Trichonephila clavipes]|nr:hypothetical protein TNCV_3419521 [Trichonephila clavipes]